MTTPIIINNLSDLQAIQNNLSGYYVLGANIDASGFNFLPIGSAANPFTGIFDGQGHTISNLTINNVSNTDSGLFGDIGATGTVSNVGLINESVTSSYSNVGGLAGDNFGTVSKSYVSGTVTGGAYVGALVGFNGSPGSITESYATGAANGINDVGGLVGLNAGAIAESYATGTINEGRSGLGIGGLVGVNTTGTITQSYAIGLLGGGGFAVGGLVGAGGGANVTASYWDTETTGRSTSGGGTGLTTAQLESGILPVGFDPTIWLDISGQFPELRWQAPPININHAPVASTIAADANEDTNILPVTLTALFTDADLSDTFTFRDDATGTVGLVTNNHDGTFAYDPNVKFEYLGVGETATDTFQYTVTDNHGASSTATATVTIHGENDLPVASPDVAVTQKGTTIAIDAAHGVLANDTDPDIHDVLHVSAVNGLDFNVGQIVHGTYGALTLKADGSYSYQANNNLGSAASQDGAVDQFSYTVTDGHGGFASSTLSIAADLHAAAATGSLAVLADAKAFIGSAWGNENCTGFVFTVSSDVHSPFFYTAGAPVHEAGAYGNDPTSLLNDSHSNNSFSFAEPISNIQVMSSSGLPTGGVQLPSGYVALTINGSTLVQVPSSTAFVFERADTIEDNWHLVGGANGNNFSTINPNDPSSWPAPGDIFRGVVIENSTANRSHELITHAGIVSSYDPVHDTLTLIDNYAHSLNGHDTIGYTTFNVHEAPGHYPALLAGYYDVYHLV